jgi:hypothetical protein
MEVGHLQSTAVTKEVEHKSAINAAVAKEFAVVKVKERVQVH